VPCPALNGASPHPPSSTPSSTGVRRLPPKSPTRDRKSSVLSPSASRRGGPPVTAECTIDACRSEERRLGKTSGPRAGAWGRRTTPRIDAGCDLRVASRVVPACLSAIERKRA
jgi:hypothetical protein